VGEWIKVVTNPLGLAGFALFLFFLFLRSTKKPEERRWLSRVFTAAALVCLIGGLGISYIRVSRSSDRPAQNNLPQTQLKQSTEQIQQNTTGAASPAIQGVQGDVSVTIDQSSGKGQPQKVQEKYQQPKKEE
jgi:hypothetical protein